MATSKDIIRTGIAGTAAVAAGIFLRSDQAPIIQAASAEDVAKLNAARSACKPGDVIVVESGDVPFYKDQGTKKAEPPVNTPGQQTLIVLGQTEDGNLFVQRAHGLSEIDKDTGPGFIDVTPKADAACKDFQQTVGNKPVREIPVDEVWENRVVDMRMQDGSFVPSRVGAVDASGVWVQWVDSQTGEVKTEKVKPGTLFTGQR